MQNKADKEDSATLARHKILYYNAFIEYLFVWNNDQYQQGEHQLSISSNSFTDWILQEQGQEQNVAKYFQAYTQQNLTPHFNEVFSAITFRPQQEMISVLIILKSPKEKKII